jgi:Disulfide bond formation protein DsbB
MTVASVELFYSILAIIALVFVGAVVFIRVLAVWSETSRRWYVAIRTVIRPNAIALAFVVAALATVGSLYFSEVAQFEPCRLCWYQRIAMYPLVIILGIAAVRRDTRIAIYAQVLAGIGAIVSGYHLALEWVPALDSGACGIGPSCTVVWFREFGFVSLPLLALSAFLTIITLSSLARSAGDGTQP